ncbi:MAG: response regulator [Xanthobacteraceae bacterium]|nr:response regulator [Xanthobacteraceae bacterium]PWB60160.1 MAG: hybrid sensor histidine kinase/response regulator [Bradyrhizobiaceae bacterium]
MTATAASSGNSIDQTEVRFLVEKNADGILVVDEEGTVLFANPAAEKIFGRGTEALVGFPIGIPFLSGETTEIAIHRPGGDQIDAEIRVVDTTWNHRPARLASIRDVSGRKAMEERLRHSAKMEAVGRLTAGIAHDFNNLLTVVLGNLENAQRQSALAETSLLRALDNATRGARRAAGLTERLLAFARRKPLDPRIIDVNTLVSGMLDLLQRTLGEGIRVRATLAPDLWPTEVDPTELEAAILNLAVNARDAMAAGGELTIETANAEADAAYAGVNREVKPGNYVLISVSDTGAGMEPAVLKHVFEPFFTTKGGRGTGLGLSQVYGFVTQSGGYVMLVSEPGIGTTAKLYLRKAQEAEVQDAEDRPPAEPNPGTDIPRARSGEVILVVEDDGDVRAYACNSLRELGYTVFEADNAASALPIVEREPDIRLLFTDLGLPGGVDGRALAERAKKIRPSLRVLITTAYAASALVHDGRLDPGVELLSKPFSLTALAARIRKVLDQDTVPEGPTRILVVEDEPLLRMLVVEMLAERGCLTVEAGSFEEAVRELHAMGNELAGAIIDIGLPDKPGDGLVGEIRASMPDLPILLATGYGGETIRERLGAQDEHLAILGKPFDPEDIAAAFQRVGLRTSGPKEK